MNKRWIFLLLLAITTFQFSYSQNYEVTAIGFYNVENLFDTIPSFDIINTDSYYNGVYPYMETVPKVEREDQVYPYWGESELSGWIDSMEPDTNGFAYLDKRDEDFTVEGSYRYTSAIYNEKLANLAKVISEMGSGVTSDGLALLGIAEVEQLSVLEDLVAQEAIADRNYQIIHHNSMDFRGIDVALIYQEKYFKPTGYKMLPVKLYEDNGDRRFTRDVLWVEGMLNGEAVHVFVNHWPSRSGGEQVTAHKRAAAAQVCKDVIDSLRKTDPNLKAIIMGDLNDDPISPSVTKVLRASGDKNSISKNGLYNPYTEKFKKGQGSNAYRDAWSLFDQIIVSPGWLDQNNGFFFYKAEIFNKPYLVQKTGVYRGYPYRSFISRRFSGGYSDHFPVLVYIVKPI